MSLRQRAVRGVVWAAIEHGGSAIVSVAVFAVLARLLSVNLIGVVALATALMALMEVFLHAGFGQALIQRTKLEPEHLDTAFWINVAACLVLMGIAVTVAPWVAAYYERPELVGIVRLLSLSLVGGALSTTQRAFLQRQLQFRSLAIRTLIATTGGGAVAIAMVLSGCGLWSLVGQILVQSAIGTVVLWVASPWRPGLKVSRRHAADLFSFGMYITGIELLSFLSRRAGDLIIGYVLSMTQLGYFSTAYALIYQVTRVPLTTVASVAFPVFSRLQHDPEQIRNAFCTVTLSSAVVLLPVFFGIAAVSPELVRTLWGSQWEASIPVVRILALVGLAHFMVFLSGRVVVASGKPSWAMALTVVRAGGNLAIFFVVARFGIVPLATAVVIYDLLMIPVALAIVHRQIQLNPLTWLGQLRAPLAVALAMWGLLVVLKSLIGAGLAPIWSLLIQVVTGATVYTVLMCWLAPRTVRKVLELMREIGHPSKERRLEVVTWRECNSGLLFALPEGVLLGMRDDLALGESISSGGTLQGRRPRLGDNIVMTMPNFLVIGTIKAGTTSLYRYLAQHPQIYMSPIKEPSHFAFDPDRSPDEGLNRFAVRDRDEYEALFRDAQPGQMVGEASPQYLWSPLAAARIREELPDAKLIAGLRNPVDRAFSSYLHLRRETVEPHTDFADALAEELPRIEQHVGPLWRYTEVGFYANQLRRYFDLFPREQIMIYLYEDLSSDAPKLLRDIFRYLGLDETFAVDVGRRHNISGVPKYRSLQAIYKGRHPLATLLRPLLPLSLRRCWGSLLSNRNLSRPRLSAEMRQKLIAQYRDDILQVQALIQRDLSSWLK